MALAQDRTNGPFSLKTFALSFLLTLCVVMGAGGIYAKVALDKAEMAMAAPEATFTPDQDLYERSVVALGYGGFLGAAQDYLARHDRGALADMRMSYKTAQEALTRVGDKASTPVRRDIKAILDLFGGIVARAEGGGDALSDGITTTDILTASTALNVLDSRLSAALAANRMQAQESFKSWSLMLTLLALGGLVLAGGVLAALLFGPKKSLAEPLQALTQSVANMAHGEIQKSIWGLERADEIGELARAIDRARLFFTQIPDVAVMGEDGAVRLKFEGESRSLFQSLMSKITESYERAQQSTLGFAGTMHAQQEVVTSLTARLTAALDEFQRQGRLSGETVERLAQQMSEASRSLSQAQDSGVAQIGRLVPMMQERVQNMAEVTHLAGQQVAQSLQSLMKSETALRASASQSHETVKQLAGATNQMGERMFAALNMMQASSKMLNETIDIVKARFNEAVDTLAKGETNITGILSRAETRLASTVNAEENMAALASRTASSAEKLEKAVNSICDRHEAVNEQVITAAHRMDSIVASFDTAQRSMNDAANQIRRDGGLVANLLAELRANNDQLLSSIGQNSQTSFAAAQGLAEKSHALMQRLEVQIQQQAQAAETHIAELSAHGQTMAQQSTTTTSTLAQVIASLRGEQEKLASSRARFTETVTDLGARLEQHATATFGKTEQWAAQGFSKISAIAEQMETVMKRLSVLGQLTGTLGAVAGQLGQLVPTLTAFGEGMPTALSSGVGAAPDMEEAKALIVRQTEEIVTELKDKWHESIVQIEAMHDQLAQLVIQQKDQLETRLVVMDKKIREAADAVGGAGETLATEEKQTEIMNELIAAMSKINEHVLDLDEVIESAGLRKEA